MKIAIFGPKDKQVPDDYISRIAGAIPNRSDLVIVTGGTVGFPTDIAKKLTSQTRDCYTPCRNREEWESYKLKGILPSMELFDNIYWSNETGDIKLRALKRIPRLVENSSLCFAYLAGQGNTHLEVLSSLSLGIPVLGLTMDSVPGGSFREYYDKLSRESKHLGLYSDIKEFVNEINRRLK